MIQHVGRALAVVVALLAWRVARRRPHHKPFATWLLVAALADIARWALGWPLDGAPVPYSGAARALFHIDQALVLVEPAGLVMVALCAIGRAGASLHVAGASALALSCMVAGYSHGLRGVGVMRWVYGSIEAAAILAVAAIAITWARRRAWPTMTEVLVALYAAVRVSLLIAGPYSAAGGPFGQWWRGDGAQVTVVLTSLAIHAAWLRAVK